MGGTGKGTGDKGREGKQLRWLGEKERKGDGKGEGKGKRREGDAREGKAVEAKGKNGRDGTRTKQQKKGNVNARAFESSRGEGARGQETGNLEHHH